MSEILLGKAVEYKSTYDKSLLCPIERSMGRNKINLKSSLPFDGFDLWNCYEVSWLNLKGRPETRIMQFIVPCTSQFLIESKSIKLYLNSFNNTKFSDDNEVAELIRSDLTNCANAHVHIFINKLEYYKNTQIDIFEGSCLDNIDVEINDYEVNSDLLESSDDKSEVYESLNSNLLKSNCLVTGQPDWASVQIKYKGPKINHHSLLKYLISYRNHNGFHEECVEHIFVDILNKCKSKELTVFAKYTRRGGIDISPLRTTLDIKNTAVNKVRDVRQ